MPFEPIATQEEFDERVKARLRRERERVMSEYSDYEDIKAAAADSAKKLDEQGRRIKELEAAADAREQADAVRELRGKVSKETGVPAELIVGDDEESMTAFAQSVADYAKKPAAASVKGAGKFSNGAKADSDMDKFVNSLFGDN